MLGYFYIGMCAIKLPHTNILTFCTILKVYYHNEEKNGYSPFSRGCYTHEQTKVQVFVM